MFTHHQADETDDENDVEDRTRATETGDLEKNMNSVNIHQSEKEKRERAKLENQKKKERDKMERYIVKYSYILFCEKG